ncbi:MAG TPA: putative peptidoglycan glycosyltransferase FtsW [Candidatus Saccharimonadales bacterium]|nr:putative peptidoglycan glycosyltransferase FtsW [Candidatus Saccharimonadales bacterium]
MRQGVGRYASRLTQSASQVVRRHQPDYQLFLFAGILILVGLIVLFAISPARVALINAGGQHIDESQFMLKQCLNLIIGMVAFFVAASLPFGFWKKYAGKILLAGLLACGVLAVLAIGQTAPALCTNGACRWYNIGFGSFQPAELLKFGTLLFLAGFLARRMAEGRLDSLKDCLWPLAVVIGLAGFLIVVAEKDMGTGLTLMGMVMTMVIAAGMRFKTIGLVLAALFAVFVLTTVTSPHRMERISTFFHPEAASQEDSYHIDQATISIGSGGLTGRGLDNSRQAFGYLPEAVNDSIFAIFGETFGFVGLLAVLGLFTALLLRLLKIHRHLADPVMRLMVAGVFGLIMSHVIVNVGAMTGIFPLTGVTLPFISFGGTSLLFTMTALGIAFQISRYTSHSEVTNLNQDETNEDTTGRRRLRRARYAASSRY